MKTRITELFGIQYPIIQGAMQWLSKPRLAAGDGAEQAVVVIA